LKKPIPGKRIVYISEKTRPYGTKLEQFNTVVGRDDGSIDVYCSFVCATQSNPNFFKCPTHHLPKYKKRCANLYKFQSKVEQLVRDLSKLYPVKYVSSDTEFHRRVALYSGNC
jgi:hypothetical protein